MDHNLNTILLDRPYLAALGLILLGEISAFVPSRFHRLGVVVWGLIAIVVSLCWIVTAHRYGGTSLTAFGVFVGLSLGNIGGVFFGMLFRHISGLSSGRRSTAISGR